MGKKGKGKKDKSKKVKEEEPPPPTEWDTKSVAEIEEDKKLLLQQLEESRVQRNYYQQERVPDLGSPCMHFDGHLFPGPMGVSQNLLFYRTWFNNFMTLCTKT
jgi:hypothetical protein